MVADPTRRQFAEACRDVVADRTAHAEESGLDPLPRRDFLRHLTQVAAEHGVRFTVSSRLVSQLGHIGLTSAAARGYLAAPERSAYARVGGGFVDRYGSQI